jgi:hypothetical protein
MVAGIGRRFVQQQHPLYQAWAPIWRKLADAFEGTGGFADGTYLVPHPREWLDHSVRTMTRTADGQTLPGPMVTNPTPKVPGPKLLERRKLARYENFAEVIVGTHHDTLFRQQPTRQVGGGKAAGDSAIESWWDDVDGDGTHVDDFFAQIWPAAATFGYLYLYLDRAAGTSGPTAADTAAPFVRVYTPLDAPDWLDDRGRLTAIKFLEPVTRTTLDEAPLSVALRYNVRYVTETDWTLLNDKGQVLEQGAHAMGQLPIVVLYARRRTLTPLVGASVLKDPSLFIDLYNLTSENRELLRKQTFSMINVPLGPDGDKERAQELVGETVGTANVLFSVLPALLLSPSGENVAAYHNEIDRLLRRIYRLAHLQWEADSRDAEATGSVKLKREDLNTALAGFADEAERADYALAKLFYAATQGADAGATAYEHDEVQIRYPDTFNITPFEELLVEAQAAMGLGMPTEFKKELRKRLVEKFLPDLPAATLKTILDAIGAAADDPSPMDAARKALLDRMQAAGRPPMPMPNPGASGNPAPPPGASV